MRRINLIKLSGDLYNDDYPYHDISSEPIFGSMASMSHTFKGKKMPLGRASQG